MTRHVLDRGFFERAPDVVAAELLGCLVVVRDGDRETRARLVETEAYGGSDDPASHAYRGRSKRNAVMFGPAGFLYLYFIYGMYWCVNVVTEVEGSATAVLLRAAEFWGPNEEGVIDPSLLRGPGKLTRGLGLSGADNGEDCCGASSRVRFERDDAASNPGPIGQSIRVGLTKGRERRSRYFLEGHAAVTRTPKTTPLTP